MKKIIPIFIFTLLAIFFGWALLHFGPAQNLDETITDANIRYFAPTTSVSDDIVIIFLDEATMKELPYRSPVPRDFLYELNEKILAAGPKIIGYDIFFKDPTLTTNDQRLAASFKKSKIFAVSAGKIDEAGKNYEDPPMELFSNALTGTGLADLPFSSSDAVVRYAQFEFPLPLLARPSFVAALYHAFTNDQRLTTNDKIRIRFTGPPSKIGREGNQFKIFPAHLVAKGLIPSDWLKDKIVLVGAAYEDGTDAYITPYYSSRYNYERMPGVEIHANILNQLITKQFFYELPSSFIFIGFLAIGLISSFLFLHGSIWRGIFGSVLLSGVLIIKIILSFHWMGLVIPFIPFEGSLLITFGACLGYRSVTEGKQKRFIKSVFAKYVPPAVVDKMIADPKLLTLGGEQREITAMFTDIASFTTISEKLDPKTLVTFLNEYLDKLTRIIFKYGGTLDKYEGDAIIAFFGAPVELPNHREAACMAAIEMQKGCAEISEKWKEICGRDIITRIGINSGRAVIGNMGSELRFDYTAIGDTMNLASRLEGANKYFGTTVLVGETTRDEGRGTLEIVFHPLARVKVKGKTEAIKVYELVGLRSELSNDIVEKIKNQPEPMEIVELCEK